MSSPVISIILVSYNEREHLAHVLQLLSQEFSSLDHEIIVVDNASVDGSAAMVKKNWSAVRLIEFDRNLMYGKGNNRGLAVARGQWLLVLNSDVDWQAGQLRSLLDYAQRQSPPGLVAPQLRYPDGRIQISGHHRFPNGWSIFVDYCLPAQQLLMRFGHHPYQESPAAHRQTHSITHASGVCLLIPRALYERIGGFDERFTIYLEETEWQRRMAEAGFGRLFVAEVALTHYGAAAKTFAQASPHFLWGLELYSRLHWPWPARRLRLLTALWTATIVSDIVLLVAWPLSWLIGTTGRRIRSYTLDYLRLTVRLGSAPTSPPV